MYPIYSDVGHYENCDKCQFYQFASWLTIGSGHLSPSYTTTPKAPHDRYMLAPAPYNVISIDSRKLISTVVGHLTIVWLGRNNTTPPILCRR